MNNYKWACVVLSLSTCLMAEEVNEPTLLVKPKFSIYEIEVKLQDGSLIRGEIKETESIQLKTAYGLLNIPLSEISRIERGERISELDTKAAVQALKDLDSDEFSKRAAAQHTLETGNALISTLIKDAREKASVEARTRIDKILGKLLEKNKGKKLQTEDAVRTTRFEATGDLQMSALKLRCRLGLLSISMSEIQSIRWMNSGEMKVFILENNQTVGMWMDTGVEVSQGDRITVNVTGTISTNNDNNEITPIGSENYGNNDKFLVGAVCGRMGQNGEPFLIGNYKSWTAETKERLYVKINWNRRGRNNDSKGQFNLKITSGVWAENAKPPEE